MENELRDKPVCLYFNACFIYEKAIAIGDIGAYVINYINYNAEYTYYKTFLGRKKNIFKSFIMYFFSTELLLSVINLIGGIHYNVIENSEIIIDI